MQTSKLYCYKLLTVWSFITIFSLHTLANPSMQDRCITEYFVGSSILSYELFHAEANRTTATNIPLQIKHNGINYSMQHDADIAMHNYRMLSQTYAEPAGRKSFVKEPGEGMFVLSLIIMLVAFLLLFAIKKNRILY